MILPGWDYPNAWGSHAFRRGYGREAFEKGGLPALFLAGGWRSMAAFAYISAQQLASTQECDFHVEFSDSDEDDVA